MMFRAITIQMKTKMTTTFNGPMEPPEQGQEERELDEV